MFIREVFDENIVGPFARDSTAIEALERPLSQKKFKKRKLKKPGDRLT